MRESQRPSNQTMLPSVDCTKVLSTPWYVQRRMSNPVQTKGGVSNGGCSKLGAVRRFVAGQREQVVPTLLRRQGSGHGFKEHRVGEGFEQASHGALFDEAGSQ